jgi:hypothetical protein
MALKENGPRLLAGQALLDDLAEDVEEELLRLLDAGGLATGDHQLDVGRPLGEAAPLAEEGDRDDLPATRLLEGGQDVAGFSAGGQDDEHIAGFPERSDLTREDLGEVIVVADCRQESRVDREGHGGIGASVLPEAAGELRGQMGAVAGASTVAAEHQLVPGKQGVARRGGRLFKIGLQRGQGREHLPEGVQRTLELAHRKRHWTGASRAVKETLAPSGLRSPTPVLQAPAIDTPEANGFDRLKMPRLFRTFAGTTALAAFLLLAGCAAPEPPQVKLDRANVLPLAINPDFVFRKKTQFLNDPATFPKTVANASEAIEFERRYYMWPATTKLDMDGLKGNYLDFYWWNHGQPADVTVRLEYRQANLGNFVMAREKSYTAVKGSVRTRFTIIGDDYLENGPVTNWRCLLIVDGKIVGLTQSYLWR